MDGRVAAMFPEWKRLRAGVWVGLKVYIERMTQMSSMLLARLGSSSLTSMPDWPWRWNSKGEGRRPPVTRSVRKPAVEGGRWPAYFWSDGLGSNMSNCDGPPTRNRKMLCLAVGRKCGPTVWTGAARACSSASMPAKPMEPRPPHREPITSRREYRWIMPRNSPVWRKAGLGHTAGAWRGQYAQALLSSNEVIFWP